MIEKHIQALKLRVLEYGELVDAMILHTYESIIARNWTALDDVVDVSEPKADAMKLEIAQESLGLIALFHPEAGHLRSIMKVSAIVIDLERMADVVVKVAIIALDNREYVDFEVYPQIGEMIIETRKMLHDVMYAFDEEDALKAVSVVANDDRVDNLCSSLLRKILRKIKAGTTGEEEIDYLIQLLAIIRYVERIADHITHIAEDVIFIKEGLTLQKVQDLQQVLSERYDKKE